MSRIFLARIKAWSKLFPKNFSLIHPWGWEDRISDAMLINFSILQHNTWYTLQKCLSFQYEHGKGLPVEGQQIEHVGNMFTINNEDTGATPLSSCLILNSFHTLFWCLVANFEQVVSCWDGWYHKQSLSKQYLFSHLIFQLLTFVLRYVQQRMEQEWAAYSFNYPLVTLLSQSVNEFIHLFIT